MKPNLVRWMQKNAPSKALMEQLKHYIIILYASKRTNQMNHRYEYHITWTRADEPEKKAAQTCHEDRRHAKQKTKEAQRKQKESTDQQQKRTKSGNKNKEKDAGPNQENQEIPRRATDLHQLRPAETAWFQEPAIVRPQAKGEQPQTQGTITMRRPSVG